MKVSSVCEVVTLSLTWAKYCHRPAEAVECVEYSDTQWLLHTTITTSPFQQPLIITPILKSHSKIKCLATTHTLQVYMRGHKSQYSKRLGWSFHIFSSYSLPEKVRYVEQFDGKKFIDSYTFLNTVLLS